MHILTWRKLKIKFVFNDPKNPSDTTKPKTTPKEEIKTKATDAIKGLFGGKKKKGE